MTPTFTTLETRRNLSFFELTFTKTSGTVTRDSGKISQVRADRRFPGSLKYDKKVYEKPHGTTCN